MDTIIKERTSKEYHSVIANYFDQKKPLYLDGEGYKKLNIRKLVEQPWQFLQLENWEKLFELLSDLDFFKNLWEYNQFETKLYWTKTNSNYKHSIINAYNDLIKNPAKYVQYLWPVAILLTDLNYLEDSIPLKYYQISHFRKTNHSLNLQASLGNTAVSLIRLGRYDEAEKLIEEQLKLCQELGFRDISLPLYNLGSIYHLKSELEKAEKFFKEAFKIASEFQNLYVKGLSLGKQAVLRRELDQPQEALRLHKEEERIFKVLNNIDALQSSLGNQAIAYIMIGETNSAKLRFDQQQIICRQIGNFDDLFNSLYNEALMQINNFGRPDLALPLIAEAYKISVDKGMTLLSKGIKPFLDQLRGLDKIPWWKKIFKLFNK